MSPEEIEQIAQVIKEASQSNTSPMYILVSVMIVFIPMAARYIKKSFKEEVSEIVTKQLETINELIEKDRSYSEKMFTIMEMHIDELKHVKVEHDELKDTQENHDKRIGKLES